MSADAEMKERSEAALRAFRDQVEALGLWDGVWLGLVAVRAPTGWVAFVVRAILTAPDVTVPPPDSVFDATTEHVRVRVARAPLSDLWELLSGVAIGSAECLSSVFGDPIGLPTGKTPSLLQFSRSHSRRERQHLLLMRSAGAPFHEIFGYELFERLGPQLRAHAPPYAGPKEIGENMLPLWGSGFEQNISSPIFEVSAELPIAPVKAFFNPAFGGIEIRTSVGRSVPLERLSVSVTPIPRRRLRGTEFECKAAGAAIELVHLIPAAEPTSDVTINLQFDDVPINTDRIRAASREGPPVVGSVFGSSPAQWVQTLQRDFHWSLARLRRRLRAVLPKRVADVAEARIEASIAMREQFPFFALVSAASVAEVLLKERLKKVRKRARSLAWGDLRSEDNKLPKRLPDDLKFDHAIRLAKHLELLDDIDSQSIDLLRVARNELHLDRDSRPSHEDFSPVRASSAILATLNLTSIVVRRAKRRQQPVRQPAAVP